MFSSQLLTIRISNLVFSKTTFRTVSNTIAGVEDPIVLTDDGTTFVCRHAQKEFPYECTKPMPQFQTKQASILKSTKEEAMDLFSRKRAEIEIVEELAKLTHTTKHRWFPNNWHKRKRVKQIKPDRPNL